MSAAGLRDRLSQAWHARAPREQRLLRIGAVILILALWGDLLWTASGRRQVLLDQTETLQTGAALARQLAGRLGGDALQATQAPTSTALPTLPALAGLNIQTAGQRYRITGTVAFDAWVAWLGEQQHGPRLVLVSARVRQTGKVGEVDVDGELERAR